MFPSSANKKGFTVVKQLKQDWESPGQKGFRLQTVGEKRHPDSAMLRASPLLHLHRRSVWGLWGESNGGTCREQLRKQNPPCQREVKVQSKDGKVGWQHITNPLILLAQQLATVISKQLLKMGTQHGDPLVWEEQCKPGWCRIFSSTNTYLTTRLWENWAVCKLGVRLTTKRRALTVLTGEAKNRSITDYNWGKPNKTSPVWLTDLLGVSKKKHQKEISGLSRASSEARSLLQDKGGIQNTSAGARTCCVWNSSRTAEIWNLRRWFSPFKHLMASLASLTLSFSSCRARARALLLAWMLFSSRALLPARELPLVRRGTPTPTSTGRAVTAASAAPYRRPWPSQPGAPGLSPALSRLCCSFLCAFSRRAASSWTALARIRPSPSFPVNGGKAASAAGNLRRRRRQESRGGGAGPTAPLRSAPTDGSNRPQPPRLPHGAGGFHCRSCRCSTRAASPAQLGRGGWRWWTQSLENGVGASGCCWQVRSHRRQIGRI